MDTSVLLYFLNENTSPPLDPSTGMPVIKCRERVNFLLAKLTADKSKVIVPTPVLSEVLVRAAVAGPAYLQILEKEKSIGIFDFNKRAAVEAAAMVAQIWADGEKPSGVNARAKLKFDVMIAAIAKINAATLVYSDDPDVKQLGKKFGFSTQGIADLALPPEGQQIEMFKPTSDG